MALPSVVAVVSVVVVVAAAAVFVLSSGEDNTTPTAGPATESPSAAVSASPRPARGHATKPGRSPAPDRTGRSPRGSHTPSPSHRSSASPSPSPSPSPSSSPIDRGTVYVEVYNNSHVEDLAGQTANQLKQTGWKVVGADNWYGTIPTSTVYYPERLHAAAEQLAEDLGIERLHPAVEPMKFDRLTVILTADYA